LNEDFNKKQLMSSNIIANVCNKRFMALSNTSYLYLPRVAGRYTANALTKVRMLQAFNCKS
jgi:hypothetical protein